MKKIKTDKSNFLDLQLPHIEDIKPEDFISDDEKKKELATLVIKNINNPLDKWAVCATLESMGMRDIDAQKEFGANDLFELGEEIYLICKMNFLFKINETNGTANFEKIENLLSSFIRYYSRGLSFMIPILGQIGLLFLLRYSLWAYIEFTEAQATIVAIGTILSFLVTGGFVQAAGREVLHYLQSKDYNLAKDSYLRLFKFNTLVVFAVGIFLFLVNFIFPFFRQQMLFLSLIYFLLLGELWYSLSLLYLIKHYVVVLLITVLGIIPVHWVMQNTTWGIFYAHFSGILFSIVLAWLYNLIWLKRKINKQENISQTSIAKRPIMAYIVSLYFVYGFLYFSFLFIDRLISWSAYGNEIQSSIIWFKTPYELGMDWALISLFITIALLEFTIERFSRLLIPVQQGLSFLLFDKFIKKFNKFYISQIILLVSFGIVSIVATYFAVTYLKRFSHISEIRDFFSNPITYFTFFVASVGYLLMSIGLFNGLFFLTLNRMKFAVRPILLAVITNIFIGLLLSRWFDYEYGVFGLLAGSLIFVIYSSKKVKDFFNKLDYYYYSAY
jgi:hypothetical protein